MKHQILPSFARVAVAGPEVREPLFLGSTGRLEISMQTSKIFLEKFPPCPQSDLIP
jgi:hypothetical protein